LTWWRGEIFPPPASASMRSGRLRARSALFSIGRSKPRPVEPSYRKHKPRAYFRCLAGQTTPIGAEPLRKQPLQGRENRALVFEGESYTLRDRRRGAGAYNSPSLRSNAMALAYRREVGAAHAQAQSIDQGLQIRRRRSRGANHSWKTLQVLKNDAHPMFGKIALS